MTRTQLIFVAASGSLALLAGAFLFQALGYSPCRMCYWQRWPHALAIFMGALALVQPRFHKTLALLGSAFAALTAGIGVYHAGVEQKWWDGPSSCTGTGELDMVDLLNTNIAPVVMCDDIVWSLGGITMAGFNGLFSTILVILWVAAARK